MQGAWMYSIARRCRVRSSAKVKASIRRPMENNTTEGRGHIGYQMSQYCDTLCTSALGRLIITPYRNTSILCYKAAQNDNYHCLTPCHIRCKHKSIHSVLSVLLQYCTSRVRFWSIDQSNWTDIMTFVTVTNDIPSACVNRDTERVWCHCQDHLAAEGPS